MKKKCLNTIFETYTGFWFIHSVIIIKIFFLVRKFISFKIVIYEVNSLSLLPNLMLFVYITTPSKLV